MRTEGFSPEFERLYHIAKRRLRGETNKLVLVVGRESLDMGILSGELALGNDGSDDIVFPMRFHVERYFNHPSWWSLRNGSIGVDQEDFVYRKNKGIRVYVGQAAIYYLSEKDYLSKDREVLDVLGVKS